MIKIYGHGGHNLVWHVLGQYLFLLLHIPFTFRLHTPGHLGIVVMGVEPRGAWNRSDSANGRRLTGPEEHLVLPTSQSEEALTL